ncbi:MAG: hypothetical protein HOI95_04285 [Chromatiales bacterium]|nr:hypothetical protein [Chromatiales bacterium]
MQYPKHDHGPRLLSKGFYRKRILGVGIVELMIAITIGMVLIAGAINVFVTSRKAYRASQQVSRILENGLYALEEIGRVVAIAGYYGQSSDPDQVRYLDPSDAANIRRIDMDQAPVLVGDCEARWYANLFRRVEGLNNSNAAYSTTCVPNTNYLPGTDILVARYTDQATTTLTANTLYLRADPLQQIMFVAPNAPDASNFSGIESDHAYHSVAFYVSPYYRSKNEVPLIPTLRRVEVAVGPTVAASNPDNPDLGEVDMEGVEDFQIQFGISAGSDFVTKYVNPDAITGTNYENIRSVRIWLLIRAESEDRDLKYTNQVRKDDLGKDREYVMPGGVNDGDLTDGVFTAPIDGFRRMVVSRTIFLRNRSNVSS